MLNYFDTLLRSFRKSSFMIYLFLGDLYQRQPLLPNNVKSEKWNHGSHSATVEYYDDEEEEDIQKTDERNGHIRIDLPPPVRDEPRFPQEKCKTFLGEILD